MGLIQVIKNLAARIVQKWANCTLWLKQTLTKTAKSQLESILSVANNHDNYSKFWQKILIKIDRSKGNKEEVYNLLASNKNLLNEEFSKSLNEWTKNKINKIILQQKKTLIKATNKI